MNHWIIKQLVGFYLMLGLLGSTASGELFDNFTFLHRIKVSQCQYVCEPGGRDILDCRFDEVTVGRIPMEEAVNRLADAIWHATGHPPVFCVTRLDVAALQFKDVKVACHARDITLRDVLDALCLQSGWSYAETPMGVRFVSPAYL